MHRGGKMKWNCAFQYSIISLWFIASYNINIYKCINHEKRSCVLISTLTYTHTHTNLFTWQKFYVWRKGKLSNRLHSLHIYLSLHLTFNPSCHAKSTNSHIHANVSHIIYEERRWEKEREVSFPCCALRQKNMWKKWKW